MNEEYFRNLAREYMGHIREAKGALGQGLISIEEA